MARPDVTVVILTFNEELNVDRALSSVCGWAKDVLVLDSFSTDRTLEIARTFECRIFQNEFRNFSQQFGYAITKLPIETEWVFILAADETIPPELREEVERVLASKPEENGFHCRFRFIWMGQWLRRGYYGTWVMRLFRPAKARMESREVNEHFIVEGRQGRLENDVIHDDRKGVTDWIAKHNRYATMEADALLKGDAPDEVQPKLLGNQTERKRWVKKHLWNRMPPLTRPWIYFGYRYFLSGAFLEGRPAFSYHFMQALWFQTLIDVKYLERTATASAQARAPAPTSTDRRHFEQT